MTPQPRTEKREVIFMDDLADGITLIFTSSKPLTIELGIPSPWLPISLDATADRGYQEEGLFWIPLPVAAAQLCQSALSSLLDVQLRNHAYLSNIP